MNVGVDIGSLLFSSLLFKKEEEVVSVLKDKNISFRVAERDGQPYLLTQDYRPTRLNLIVNGGIIIKITTG